MNRNALVFPILILLILLSTDGYCENDNIVAELRKYQRADVYLQVAIQNIEHEAYDMALTHLKEALKIQPNYEAAYLYIGLAYASQKKYSQAIKYYKKTIKLLPKTWEPYYNLGVVYHNIGKDEEALKQVAKLRELDENEPADSLEELIKSGEIADGHAINL